MMLQRAAALPRRSPLARLGVDHGIELGLKTVDFSRARTCLAWTSLSGSREGQHNEDSGVDGRTSTGSLLRLSPSCQHHVASPRVVASPILSGSKMSGTKDARSCPDRARTPVVIDGVVYDRVPARALVRTGPRHTERNGVRVGRGSVIPEWIDTAPR